MEVTKVKSWIDVKNKEQKGITLIALVITIIILLILAGVTIASLTGENGILTRATDASETNEQGAKTEELALLYNEWQLEKLSGETANGFAAWLQENRISRSNSKS